MRQFYIFVFITTSHNSGTVSDIILIFDCIKKIRMNSDTLGIPGVPPMLLLYACDMQTYGAYYFHALLRKLFEFCYFVAHECSKTDAYKSATIALAVIIFISIVINILLVLYIVRKMPISCFKDHHPQPGHAAAATETTHAAGGEDYEELDMTSPTQPVYSHIRR